MSNCINLSSLIIRQKEKNNREPLLSHFTTAKLDILSSIVANNNIDPVHYTDDDLITIEMGLRNNGTKFLNGVADNVEVRISSKPYLKNLPKDYPNVNFVFTENAQAYSTTNELNQDWINKDIYPVGDNLITGVSDNGGWNQAGIRASSVRTTGNTNINQNAYGITVKKYQQKYKHNENGTIGTEWLAKEGQFTDSIEDFELFRNYCEHMFSRLLASKNETIVFPSSMGLGKAALPEYFLTSYLQPRLLELFGIESTIEENKKADYSGYGLRLIGRNKGKIKRYNNTNTDNFDGSSKIEVSEKSDIESTEITKTADDMEKEALAKFGISINPEQNNQKQEDAKQDKEKSSSETVEKTDEIKTPKPVGADTVTIQDQDAADQLFNARERRDRVELIARLFSKIVDIEVKKKVKELEKQAVESNTDFDKSIASLKLAYYNRIDIINDLTPGKIFNKIYNFFIRRANESLDDLTEEELAKITDESISEEEKLKLATKQAEHIKSSYTKLVSNKNVFKILCTEASRKLMFTEGIVCDPFILEVHKPNLATMEDNGTSIIDDTSDSSSKEESVKEGWMTYFRNISNMDSLSMEVRRTLSKIPKIIYGNKVERDDLGNMRYLDPYKVHAAVMKALKNMDSVDDMIPLLEKASKAAPYLKRIIKVLENQEELKSKFYQNFRKDTTNYWIQSKRVNKDGSTTYITKQVNKPEGITPILSNIRSNYESNTRLTTLSVYGDSGAVDKNNAMEVNSIAYKLLSLVSNIKHNHDFADNINKLLTSKDKLPNGKNFFNNYVTILKSLGIEVDPERLKTLLTIDNTFDPSNDYLVIQGLLQAAIEITEGIFKGKVKDEITEDGEKIPGDLIHTYEYQYKKIAYALAFIVEDDVEDSTYENGKSYYAHNKPSYCKKIINRLKNVRGLSEEEYKKYIREEYELDPWFYDENTGIEYNVWIELLKENRIEGYSSSMRELLDHKVVLHADKIEYDKWDDLDTLLVLFSEYNAGTGLEESTGSFAWYHMPVLSDATSAEFIKFIKYTGLNYQKEIIKNFRRLVNQEVRRIDRVNKRAEKIEKGELKPIANYDRIGGSKGGAEFKFLPALNTYKSEDGKLFLEKLDELLKDSTKTSDDVNEFIDKSIEDILNTGFEKAFTKWVSDGILTKTSDGVAYKYLPYTTEDYNEGDVKERFREFYYNSKFAQSQIIQLLTTDLAFYKNTTVFIKRIKEVHSPALKLNTKATFNGERVGKDYEKVVYLKDIKVVSGIVDDIIKVFKSHGFTDEEANAIADKYRNVNVADAQAYRSLKSYREIMIMAGTWGSPDGANERAYQHLINNTWTKEDFNVVWQSIKPFMYTQVMQNDPTGGKLKVPVQHKNSEFLLLAATVLNSPINQSPVLRALNEFMDENKVDCVMFESSVKVGCQGAIDINNMDASEVKETLSKYIMKNGEQDPEVVHTIPYEDYGIQVENPQHAVDAMNLIGTQQRKLGIADISDDAVFEIRGKKFTKKEIIALYNEIIVDNQTQDAAELEGIFYSQETIAHEIRKQLIGSVKYSADLEKACKIDDKGRFVMPLFENRQSVRVQALLYSIIKSRQTKQRIKGGSFVQTSCFGLERKPKIVFDYKDGKPRVKYIECYIPCYDSRLYELLYDEKTGTLDINKLPEELRWINSIRIPTEDKYSTFPLRIVGFTPQQNGNTIILPEEVTVITGSDFDFDKDYVSFPEFDVIDKIDYKKFKELVLENPGFKKWGKDNVQMTIDMIINGNIHFEPGSPEQHLLEYFNNVKDSLTYKKIKPIEYNFEDKTKNGRKSRNNLYIEILNSILTNTDMSHKLLNPGGMDAHKRASKIFSIINNIPIKKIKDYLITKGYNEIKSYSDLVLLLTDSKKLPLDVVEDLAKSVAVVPDPLSPVTYIDYHNKNMAGINLIGIYANQSSNHAVSQHSEMEINSNGAFRLGGKVRYSLYDIKAIDGEYISRYLAGFIQAAVDNAKELVLYDLNQNTYTADITGLLTRLGYDPLIIGALLNQPIIKDIVTGYIRDTREGVSKDTVVKNVIKKYAEKARTTIPEYIHIYKAKIPFTVEDLLTNIIIYNNKNDLTQDFYKKQVEVGVLFTQILKDSEKLSDLIHATKADTSNGSAGPTIGDTKVMTDRLIDLNVAAASEKYPISGITFIKYIPVVDDEGDPRELSAIKADIMESVVPFIQGFYTYGLTKTEDLLEQFFPFNKLEVKMAVSFIRGITKTGKLTANVINDIYNNLLIYELSKTKFFGEEDDITAEQKRDYYMNRFPNDFIKLKLKYKELLEDNEFIQNITYSNPNKKHPTGILQLTKSGRMTETLRDSYKQDWASLLYSDNEEIRNLTFDLVKYSYFRNGLSYTPEGFGNLAPLVVLLSINEYVNALYDIIEDNSEDADKYNEFVNQYILNHLHNTKFAPLIDATVLKDTNVSIIENNQLVDEFDVDFDPDNIPTGLDNMVKDIYWEDNVKRILYMNYINIRYNNTDNFYKKVTTTSGVDKYVKVQRLGLRNNFLEYDHSKKADEMTSMVHDVLKENLERSASTVAALGAQFDQLFAKRVLNADNNSNDDNSNDTTDNSEILVNGVKIDVTAALQSAMGFQFKNQSQSQSNDNSANSDNKTMIDYKPVDDLKDDNNDPVCGAGSINSGVVKRF